jgi:hypothetical protein
MTARLLSERRRSAASSDGRGADGDFLEHAFCGGESDCRMQRRRPDDLSHHLFPAGRCADQPGARRQLVAVEVHNFSLGSPDVVFGTALSYELGDER